MMLLSHRSRVRCPSTHQQNEKIVHGPTGSQERLAALRVEMFSDVKYHKLPYSLSSSPFDGQRHRQINPLKTHLDDRLLLYPRENIHLHL